MKPQRNQFLLFNWVFLSGLLVLVLNDHYLKWAFSNALTGKLSDFAGLLIFPLFLGFLFPRLSKTATWITGALFVFWKLPLSESAIAYYNRVALIPVVRTVDYTDLVALAILPLAHVLMARVGRFALPARLVPGPLWLLVPSSLAFMATSPPISYYMKPHGDIHIGKSYRLKVSKEQVLQRLQAEGFTIRPDTAQRSFRGAENYVMENVVLPGGKDTIRSIEFGFMGEDKPLLLLNNVTLTGDRKLSNWRVLKHYTKHYRKLIRSELFEEAR